MKRVLPLLAAAFIVILSGCDPEPDPGLSLDASLMLAEAKKGSPLLENAANVAASVKAIPSRAPGDPLQLALAYAAFKDFDPSLPGGTSEQGVDGSNIWVDLHSAFSDLEGLLPGGEEFPAPTAVEPNAVLMAGAGETYTHHGLMESGEVGNARSVSWAAEIEGSITKLLQAAASSESDGAQTSRQALFVEHDAETGALLVDVNYFVDYSAESSMGEAFYSPKIWVNGNTLSNEFQVIASNYNGGPSSCIFSSLIGAGTNTGADEYMIFHETVSGKDGDGPWSSSVDAWYKVPAGAGPAELDAAAAYASLDALLAEEEDPKDYASKLQGLIILTYADIGVKVAASQADFEAALSFD